MFGAYIIKNRHILSFLCFFIFGISLYANASYLFRDNPRNLRFFPPFREGINQNNNTHLGGEYYFIAESLAAGKGFSNPFQVDTGPTAWMPPLYPFFLALLIKLFKIKAIIACCIIFLKNIALIAAGVLIYETAKKTRVALRAEISVVLYCLIMLTSFRWFFQITHDEWLLLVLICIVFAGAVFIRDNQMNFKQVLAWGCVGGICILTSPILGCVWVLTALFTMAHKKNVKPLLCSLFIFCVTCAPWFIRNYAVFDKLILMKSNFYFDLYTTNYETEHGLSDEATFVRQHPVWTTKNDPNAPYKTLGEVKFMDLYKDKFLKAFTDDPQRYFTNIKNRLVAALLVYPPYSEYEESTLVKNVWHALPFICMIFIMLCSVPSTSNHITIAIFIYSLYLLPYIAVNYYIRYSIPLTPFKVLFLFWGIDVLLARAGLFFPNTKAGKINNFDQKNFKKGE